MKNKFNLFMLKCLLFLMPVPLIYLLLFKAGYPPATTTNALFDLKMMDIQKHQIRKVKIMGAGASITLYALNSEMLLAQYPVPYHNFGAWRIQVSDIKDLLTVFVKEYQPTYVLYCSSIGDFRRKPDPDYLAYVRTNPFIRYHFPELFYLTKYSSIYRLINRVDREKHLAMDPWGAMPLQVQPKDISQLAWNDHWDFPNEYTSLQYRELDTLAAFLQEQHVKLVFIQCPIKAAHVNSPQAGRDLMSHFDTCKRIVEARGGAFLNYYDTTMYVDSLFMDQYHLQATGGRLMTKELLNDLRTIIK